MQALALKKGEWHRGQAPLNTHTKTKNISVDLLRLLRSNNTFWAKKTPFHNGRKGSQFINLGSYREDQVGKIRN